MPQIFIFIAVFTIIASIARSFSTHTFRWCGYAVASFLAAIASSYVYLGIDPWVDFGQLIIHDSPIAHSLTLGHIVVVLLVILALSSIRIIEQGNEAIVEFLGRYKRTIHPGIHFVIPFFDQVIEVSVREQILEISRDEVISADNAIFSISAVLYWRILDLGRAYYNIEDIEGALENIVLTTLRTEIGRMPWTSVSSSRSKINIAILTQIDDASYPWGIKVTRVEIQDIMFPDGLRQTLSIERIAESNHRASILETEGLVEAVKRMQEAIPGADFETLLRYLLARQYMSNQSNLAHSENAKVVFMDPKYLTEAISDLILPDYSPIPESQIDDIQNKP